MSRKHTGLTASALQEQIREKREKKIKNQLFARLFQSPWREPSLQSHGQSRRWKRLPPTTKTQIKKKFHPAEERRAPTAPTDPRDCSKACGTRNPKGPIQQLRGSEWLEPVPISLPGWEHKGMGDEHGGALAPQCRHVPERQWGSQAF